MHAVFTAKVFFGVVTAVIATIRASSPFFADRDGTVTGAITYNGGRGRV